MCPCLGVKYEAVNRLVKNRDRLRLFHQIPVHVMTLVIDGNGISLIISKEIRNSQFLERHLRSNHMRILLILIVTILFADEAISQKWA